MRAKSHKGLAVEAEQRELPFFPEKRGKGDIPVPGPHLLYVRTKQSQLRGQWIKAILEMLSDYQWIIGLAMLTSVPLLWWIVASNLHNTPVILEVLGLIAGLWGVHAWWRRSKNKRLKKQEQPRMSARRSCSSYKKKWNQTVCH